MLSGGQFVLLLKLLVDQGVVVISNSHVVQDVSHILERNPVALLIMEVLYQLHKFNVLLKYLQLEFLH